MWEHVFAAAPAPEGGELKCPMPDEEGVCGTFFLYMPFGTKEEAEAGQVGQKPGKWAPWARGERWQ